MKRVSLLFAATVFAVSCGSSSTTPSAPTKPTFTAALLPSNETSAILGGEQIGSGTVTITFDVTKDANGTITSGTATFVCNVSGFPPGTSITAAHIHPGAAGVPGGVIFSTQLPAPVVLANGSGSFTQAGIPPQSPTVFQQIIDNPAGFYFNIHSTLNQGGVARGQLAKVQ